MIGVVTSNTIYWSNMKTNITRAYISEIPANVPSLLFQCSTNNVDVQQIFGERRCQIYFAHFQITVICCCYFGCLEMRKIDLTSLLLTLFYAKSIMCSMFTFS